MNLDINELVLLAEKNNYITPLKYVSGRIVEYDIKSANITMLRKYNKIDDNYYNYLKGLPKINREVEVGLLIRNDKSYYDIIHNGIIEAKKELFLKNSINPTSIVRIANDAVYINDSRNLIYTEFGDVIFNIKSVTSSMIKLDNIIIFFWIDDNGMNIDCKGINETAQKLHGEYLLSVIAQTIYMLERVSVTEALKYIGEFYEHYVNLKLPVEYYRELNSESRYRYKYSNFYLFNVNSVEDVDINYNLYLLRELWSIVLEKYNIEIQRR